MESRASNLIASLACGEKWNALPVEGHKMTVHGSERWMIEAMDNRHIWYDPYYKKAGYSKADSKANPSGKEKKSVANKTGGCRCGKTINPYK
jgi:hypothetical protein